MQNIVQLQVFSLCSGFNRLRMHNKNGTTVAFAEYATVAQATQAMYQLQGKLLSSSDRGGIRIEFAKNKMGDYNNGCW